MKQEKYRDIIDLNSKKYLRFISLVYLSLIIVVLTLFFTDLIRMRNHKPVVFSTWGFSYSPPIDIKEAQIEISIIDFLTDKGDREYRHHENEKTFASIRIYLLEEKSDYIYHVYAWVLEEKYYLENGEIQKDSGSSIPYKFVVKESSGNFTILNAIIPRDGNYYEDDIKSLFPRTVRKNMEKVQVDGTIEKLILDIQQQLKLYFH
ncbi:MAG: hypothetical protein ACOX1F_00505 [Erysipelotrichaceae bacterium]